MRIGVEVLGDFAAMAGRIGTPSPLLKSSAVVSAQK